MKIELNWGVQYGGWIKGTVTAKARLDEELVEMHGQPSRSSNENAWQVEFDDGDVCAVDLRPGWAGHRNQPGAWRPLTYADA